MGLSIGRYWEVLASSSGKRRKLAQPFIQATDDRKQLGYKVMGACIRRYQRIYHYQRREKGRERKGKERPFAMTCRERYNCLLMCTYYEVTECKHHLVLYLLYHRICTLFGNSKEPKRIRSGRLIVVTSEMMVGKRFQLH